MDEIFVEFELRNSIIDIGAPLYDSISQKIVCLRISKTKVLLSKGQCNF
jgi:hypothetical protein